MQHSSRLVGGVETVSWDRQDTWQGSSRRTGESHICLLINREEQLGSETDCATQGSRAGKRKPHNLWLQKPVGVAAAGETASLTGESVGEARRVLECTQAHLPRSQHQKDLIYSWVVEEVTESRTRIEQVALFSL